MTLVDASTGEVIAACSPEDARRLTEQIKVTVEGAWLLIKQAYETRAWSALGYGSWDDYCTREFGAARLRLPREERQEVVMSLRDAGLSIRAIAAATGDSYTTVQRTIESGDPNGPPELAEAEPKAITGTDGKKYQPHHTVSTQASAVAERKEQVTALAAKGYISSQIAAEMGISEATVKTLARSVGVKLFDSRSDARGVGTFDADRVIDSTLEALELELSTTLSLMENRYASLDRSKVEGWVSSIENVRKFLNKLAFNLKEKTCDRD